MSTVLTVTTIVQHYQATGGMKALGGPPPTMANPFTGIIPNFTVLGADFNALWKKLFGAAWAIVLVLVAARFLTSFVEMAQHKGGSHPQQLAESRGSVINSGITLGAVVGFGIILTLIFALIS